MSNLYNWNDCLIVADNNTGWWGRGRQSYVKSISTIEWNGKFDFSFNIFYIIFSIRALVLCDIRDLSYKKDNIWRDILLKLGKLGNAFH